MRQFGTYGQCSGASTEWPFKQAILHCMWSATSAAYVYISRWKWVEVKIKECDVDQEQMKVCCIFCTNLQTLSKSNLFLEIIPASHCMKLSFKIIFNMYIHEPLRYLNTAIPLICSIRIQKNVSTVS